MTYYANGNKMSEGDHHQGRKEGLWILYRSNGGKKSETRFVNGQYTGLLTSYYENGTRRWQGYYNEAKGNSTDGTKEGVWHDYEEDGETVQRRMTYHRGSKTKKDEYAPFEE